MPKLIYLKKYKNILIYSHYREVPKIAHVFFFHNSSISFFFLPLFPCFYPFFFYLNIKAASWITIFISWCMLITFWCRSLSYSILLFYAQSLLPLPLTHQQVFTLICSKYTFKYTYIHVKYLVFILCVPFQYLHEWWCDKPIFVPYIFVSCCQLVDLCSFSSLLLTAA